MLSIKDKGILALPMTGFSVGYADVVDEATVAADVILPVVNVKSGVDDICVFDVPLDWVGEYMELVVSCESVRLAEDLVDETV